MLRINVRGLYRTRPKSFDDLAALNPEIGIEELARFLDDLLRKRKIDTRMVGEVICYVSLEEASEDVVHQPEEALAISLRTNF